MNTPSKTGTRERQSKLNEHWNEWMLDWMNACMHAYMNALNDEWAEGMTHNERNKWMQICMKEWVAEWLKKETFVIQ